MASVDVITMVQTLTHAYATLDRCHSNYLAQINIDITQSANRTNDVVARLTALASIIVPLNLVTGLWGSLFPDLLSYRISILNQMNVGMNVKVPGQDMDNLTWWWSIIGFMVLFMFLVMAFARWKRLI